MSEQKPWALITGSSGGIGEALVSEYVNEGYRVIAMDRFVENSQPNENIFYLKLDLIDFVSSEDTRLLLCNEVKKITSNEGIKVLVNNAALQILGKTDEISFDDWKLTWDVNLNAPFLLIQSFLSQLESNNGAIVNISSIHATQTKKQFVAYATSKGALSSLTRNLAVDLGSRVRINAIEPAAVKTKMLVAGFEGRNDELELLKNYHPIGRIADPKEIAELAVFLCSDKGRFIHGACVSVAGGIANCLSDPST